jgi:hypothetical protein
VRDKRDAEERVQAERDGAEAFRQGSPITSPSRRNKEEWERGWKKADVDAKVAAESRRQSAMVAADLRQRELRQRESLTRQQKQWEAAEEKLKADGFYDTSRFAYDQRTMQEMSDQMARLTDDASRQLQLTLMEGLSYKVERDKYRTISTFLSRIGIENENAWLTLYDLSLEHHWSVDH